MGHLSCFFDLLWPDALDATSVLQGLLQLDSDFGAAAYSQGARGVAFVYAQLQITTGANDREDFARGA